jgi:hypothetical protein
MNGAKIILFGYADLANKHPPSERKDVASQPTGRYGRRPL